MKHYKKLIAAGMALCVTASCFMPSSVNAASSMKSALMLKKGKAYSYDMNFDGKKETIKVDSKSKQVKDDTKTEYTVTVNGKQIYKGQEDISGQFYLMDIDKKDKQLDFILLAEYVSDGATYYTYHNGKLERKQDLGKIGIKTTGYKYASCHSIYPYKSSISFDGKNKVTIPVCIYTRAVGTAHLKMTLQLNNNKLVDKSNGTLQTLEECDNNRVKKSFPLYKSAGSKTVAFKTKKGDELKYKTVVFIKGKGYIKAELKGKTGWLGLEQFEAEKYFYLDNIAHV